MQARRCATDIPAQSGDRIVPSAKRYSVTLPFRHVATDFCFSFRVALLTDFFFFAVGVGSLAVAWTGSSYVAWTGSSTISRMTAEAS